MDSTTYIPTRPETHPPRDGTTIKALFMGQVDDRFISFDASAWGGRGGWFDRRGRAYDEKQLVLWEPLPA